MKKVLLIAGALVFTVFAANAQQKAAEEQPAAEISFEKVVHDYGKIYQGGDGNCIFKFKNTGTEPLTLTSVRSSCGCTTPKWTKEPILPGKEGEIYVHYDTKRMGVISKQITVISNAKTSTVVLKIKGEVIAKPAEVMPEKQLDEEASPVNK